MVHCSVAMGQNTSLPRGRKKSLRTFYKRASSLTETLSHTFTIHETDDKIEQLNINSATEEDLMTLDGVNREIAKNIIEHRKVIGRFRKVEDLVLVRGIGAEKLQRLRAEICVSFKKGSNQAASRAPSYDSLRSTESKSTLKFNGFININKATVFELQMVTGITQEIAAAIVHYRQKKGEFRQVEDLLKVKCIDRMRLHNIATNFTVENFNDTTEIEDEIRPQVLTNGYTMPCYNDRSGGFPRKLPVTNGLTNSSEADIFELLSAYSPRPIVPHFEFSHNENPVVRIGCWNLQDFSYEKARNPGVREVICRTILENGLSILALQDIVNVTALRIICEELNNPVLQRIREWKNKQYNWNFCMLDTHDSKLGFIYDSDGAFDIELISLNEGPAQTRNECEVLIATFRVDNLYLLLVNLMPNKGTNLKAVNKALNEFINVEDMLMLFLDFSNLNDVHLPLGNLKALFSPSTKTTFSPQGARISNAHISNVLCNPKLQKQLSDRSGVIRQGLTHLAIPNGWSWGGPVSPFCPLWVELFISPDDSTNL